MALPVAFAACTSEEIIESTQDQNLGARKALGDVELAFGEGVDSRLAVSETGDFIWAAGDGVGACLVDVYSPVEGKPAIKSYNLTNYIQTNYQYKRDEAGKWTTSARMVEGNYMFYAPYNGNHLTRTSILAGAPTEQNLTLNEDGTINQYSALDEFVKSGKPAYVGYKFLAAEGQENKVAVNMVPLYSYPEITIDNTTLSASEERDLNITKVVITYTGGFATEAPITIGTAGSPAAAATEGVVGMLYNYGTHNATTNAHGTWVLNTKAMKGNRTSQVTGDAKKKNNVVTINMPNGGYTVKVGETIKFNVVLPAEQYGTNTVAIYAYTAEGKAVKLQTRAFDLSTGKIYVDSRYKADGSFSSTLSDPLKVENVIKARLVDAPNIVYSTDELETLIASASADVAGITFANDDVKLTAAVAAAAANNSSFTYSFDSEVAIVGGTAEAPVTLKNFIFKNDNGATIESGVVKLAGDAGKITVKAGTTLNIDNATADVPVVTGAIVNHGTVNVNDVLQATSLTLKSNSILNVNAADNAQSAMGIVFNTTEKTAADVIIGATLNLTKAFTVDADLSIPAKSTATISDVVTVESAKKLSNGGSMTNNGTIKGNGTFENAANAELTNNGVVVTKTVENKAKGEVTNNKYFGLSGSAKATTSTNNGIIEMGVKTARAYVTAGTGEIDNTILGKVTGGSSNIITVTISEDMENFEVLGELGKFSKLYLNGGTWTIDSKIYNKAGKLDDNTDDMNWINGMSAAEKAEYGCISEATIVLNGGNIALVKQNITVGKLEVTAASTIYGDESTEKLTSAAVITGSSLSAEFASVVSTAPVDNSALASSANKGVYLTAETTVDNSWVGTAGKTTTFNAVVPMVLNIPYNLNASSASLKGKLASGTNVTILVTGYSLATSYATEAALETAIAALTKPAYLTAETPLVSGTIKVRFQTSIGSGDTAKTYQVELAWDATNDKWGAPTYTEVVA